MWSSLRSMRELQIDIEMAQHSVWIQERTLQTNLDGRERASGAAGTT